MAANLTLIHDRDDGESDTYHLKPGIRYRIGRGSVCEIRILDMKMSRQHCAIEHRQGVWLVIDLGSTNGAYVDGHRVTGATPVQRGSSVVAGNTRLDVTAIDTESHRRAETDGGASSDTRTNDFRPLSDSRVDNTAKPLTRLVNEEEVDEAEATHAAPMIPDPEKEQPAPERKVSDAPDSEILFAPQDITQAPESQALVAADGHETKPKTGETSRSRRRISIRIDKNGDQVDEEHEFPETELPPDRKRTSDQLLFINVLGRRVGPITRATARELKARELAGTLTETDLAPHLDQ